MFPERIVCLTEESTEVLYLLGEGHRVVGVSAWTVRPPEAREKPVVSGFVGGNVKKIVALEPDLVIGFSDVQADLASRLVRANLDVWITNPRSIDEILDRVRMLGRIVGRGARADELADGWRARIEAARARSATLPHRPRVYFEEWPDPMICGIRWVSELIEAAGGEDVFAERSRARAGAAAKDRQVTSEEVLARAPEVMLASWCGKAFRPESVRARRGWEGVPAVQAGRLHEMDPSTILQPGPGALTGGLDALERILAPQGAPSTSPAGPSARAVPAE